MAGDFRACSVSGSLYILTAFACDFCCPYVARAWRTRAYSMPETKSNASNKLAVWLGAYGAIVATLAFSWNVFQYVDSRPRLHIQVRQSQDLGDSLMGKYTIVNRSSNPTSRLVNGGSKPLTIYLLYVEFQLRDTDRSRRLKKYAVSFDDTPMRIEAGDTKEWRPGLFQTTHTQSSENTKETGRLHLSIKSTNGNYEKSFDWTISPNDLFPEASPLPKAP
jgi:hypothetical protein